jgi:uncharacterized repeat protein (TIGR03843 family)
LLPHVDGTVYGCDHGVTFHQENKLRTVLWQWAGSAISEVEEEALVLLLSEIKSNRLDNLSDLITESEISALILRIEDLLTTKSFPLPSQEWPAIPWPAF